MAKDYTNGDHSFKNWFKIMWKNFYIQLFLLGLAFTIYGFIDLEGIDQLLLIIPILAMIAIAYLGFYKFWKELRGL